MPELSRFFGIIIRMYMEVGGPHHLPHFHAYYQEEAAVFGLDPIELIADWHRLQSGQVPLAIDPLV